jgi:2-polyprenylphenol 6-hydroxylase
MTDIYDVVIVGGGPVGACAAALLARGFADTAQPLRICILEPNRPTPPAADSALDSRVVALSRASERILETAGAWRGLLGPRVAAYERMRIWHESAAPSSTDTLVFDAAEVGEPNLGYIVENRLLQTALLDAALQAGVHIEFAALRDLEVGDQSVTIRTTTACADNDSAGRGSASNSVANGPVGTGSIGTGSVGTGSVGAGSAATDSPGVGSAAADSVGAGSAGVGTLSARLVIGADGANSAVRRAIGLTADVSDFNQTAIIANVATERPHADTAWQRFMRRGTLAFLPLADGNSSIVWSADNDVAATLVKLSAAEFEIELDRASDHALGRTRLLSERFALPLKHLAAHRYVAHRSALIGDAAHVVHPLAGQGVNLGLLDAAVLSELILAARTEREDPGALRVLRRYERWRKSEVAFMSTAIRAFDQFLAHGAGPLSRLAQRGLGWINRSQEVKRFFVSRALGVAGELPRTAR